MKILAVALFLIALAGCQSAESERKQTPGEAAGHAAYEVQQGAKKVAKEAAKDIKSFAHDAKDGFQDAKQKDQEKKRSGEAERDSK